jgi:hypothetical protein
MPKMKTRGMKFIVTFKTPDAVLDAIERELPPAIVGNQEEESLRAYEVEKLAEFVAKWVRYGEYVDIEFDTEAGTATVLS